MTISNSNHDPYGTRDRARLGARSRTVSIKRISDPADLAALCVTETVREKGAL